MPNLLSRLAALVDELKRRGVLRVAAVYLVGAWLLIQVADIVFPRLGMPDWTITFVIVLAAMLFPVLVGVAWAFDFTRRGFERTAPREAPGPVEPGAVPAPRPPRQPRPHATVVTAALMTIPLIGFGLWYVNDARGYSLDENLVAITPFRVAGASADAHYLREGLMDLVAARIGGAGSDLKVVPPRTISRRLKDLLGSLEADPDRDEALGLARDLGAGLLLEGEVVGSADRLTVTASLFDAYSGREIGSPVTIPTHPDSLHRLVDQIATRLVAAGSGVSGDRLSHLTTASVPALRAFLEGERAFRRGQHEAAVRAYDHAVSLDTTFALAALGLVRARGWTWNAPVEIGWERAVEIVRRGADRLGEADRLFFESFLGRQTTGSNGDLVRVRLRAAERMPDVPELRYLAGDALLHFGESIGIEDAVERAVGMLDETVAMDSTYAEPLIHLYDIAVSAGDTARTRRYGDLLLAIDSAGPYAAKVRYARTKGYAGGDYEAIDIDPDTLEAPVLRRLLSLGFFLPYEEPFVEELVDRFRDAAMPQDLAGEAGLIEQLGMRRGQPSLVRLARRRQLERRGTDDIERMLAALYWLADADSAAAAAAAMRAALENARAAADPAAPPPFEVTARECFLGHYALSQGDFDAPPRIAERLEGAGTEGRDYWSVDADVACALYLRTASAVHRREPDAMRRLEAYDDTLRSGRPVDHWINPVYQLAVARLWEIAGRPERALAAVRRRLYLPGGALWHVEMWGEEARLADQLGRRDEAIAAYQRYLAFREHAEPPFRERADAARVRLAALVGERQSR